MGYGGLVLLTAAGAFWMDLRWAKIKNGWIVLCLAAALISRLAEGGPAGLVQGLAGAFMALLLTGWLFAFRMLGAGDIKLLAVLGLFMGPGRLLTCLLYTLAFGAVQAAWILISEGLWRERFQYLLDYIQGEVSRYRAGSSAGYRPLPYRRGSVERPENFHFSLPILLSVILYLGGVY